ncbi:hypothetical protein D3C87_1323030 [compost metagenome]
MFLVGDLARRHLAIIVFDGTGCPLLIREGDVVIVVEIITKGRDPGEIPAHALAIGLDLCERCAGDGNPGDIVIVQMRQRAFDMIAEERAADTALVPIRAEHEMIDKQLAAAIEKLDECLSAGKRLEGIIFVDLHPRERLARRPHSVAQVGFFLLKHQKFKARIAPFILVDDRIVGVILCGCGDIHARNLLFLDRLR